MIATGESSQVQDLLLHADCALRSHELARGCELLNRAAELAVAPPLRNRILLRLAETQYAREKWRDAADAAGRALNGALEPSDQIQACAFLCRSVFRSEGRTRAMATYRALRPHVKGVALSNNPSAADLKKALSCAITGGDRDLARVIFGRWVTTKGDRLPTTHSSLTTVAAWRAHQDTASAPLEPAQRFCGTNGSAAWDYTSEPFNITTLQDAEILSGWDYAITSTGEVLSDLSFMPLQRSLHYWYQQFAETGVEQDLHSQPEGVEPLDIEAVLLSGPPNFSVGHWLVDYLPRLRALARYPNAKLLIPAGLPDRLRDYLPHFGLKSDRLIECRLGQRYRVRLLIVVQPGDAFRPSIENARFVGEALRIRHALETRRGFFLVRDIETRKIRNQAEMDGLLLEFGMEKVCLGSMSLEQQRSCLAEADTVIATYGSDLLAHYFMREGSTLVELNWNPSLNSAAAQYCDFLGLKYHLFACSPIEGGEKTVNKDSDFIVDTHRLRELLFNIRARGI